MKLIKTYSAKCARNTKNHILQTQQATKDLEVSWQGGLADQYLDIRTLWLAAEKYGDSY
jgi:hypothetical protein